MFRLLSVMFVFVVLGRVSSMAGQEPIPSVQESIEEHEMHQIERQQLAAWETFMTKHKVTREWTVLRHVGLRFPPRDGRYPSLNDDPRRPYVLIKKGELPALEKIVAKQYEGARPVGMGNIELMESSGDLVPYNLFVPNSEHYFLDGAWYLRHRQELEDK